MRLVVGLAVLALATACGGSSAVQELRAQPPSGVLSPPAATQPPLVTLPVGSPQPHRTAQAPPDVAASPEPAGAVVPNPTAAYAGTGTATSGPGRVSSPAASPRPRPTPTAVDGTVTVTDEDSGTTVHLVVGQHLRVRLTSGTWDPPVSSTDVVVRQSSSGGYPSDAPVDAVFGAAKRGTADVTAESDAACFHTEPRCMMASRQWQVRVSVS